jgi:hypothetical protein
MLWKLMVNIYFQLQDLKQRASGNTDETFLNPGISEKQPLHVVMVKKLSEDFLFML